MWVTDSREELKEVRDNLESAKREGVRVTLIGIGLDFNGS